MKIECDEREANALLFLIDAAIKTVGLRGAGDAVLWVQKIEAAAKAEKDGLPPGGNVSPIRPRSGEGE